MKIKNKGKVHPSPSSNGNIDVVVLSVLSLLPQAILPLVSLLSLQDREVFAYMTKQQPRTSSKKRQQPRTTNRSHSKSSPMFDCECFECYTAYWVRWDSSPNRDLIHKAIDAFEEHVSRPNNIKKQLKPRKPIITCSDPVVVVPPVVINSDDVSSSTEEEELIVRALGGSDHRGLARKVLPDVLGLFNSRLWSLWSPNASAYN